MAGVLERSKPMAGSVFIMEEVMSQDSGGE